MDFAFVESSETAIPLIPVTRESLASRLEEAPSTWQNWVAAAGFEAEPGSTLRVPDAEGGLAAVLAGFDADTPIWMLAASRRDPGDR